MVVQEGALQALDLVAGLIRERGGEAAVLEALREARDSHQRVMASQQRPGPVRRPTPLHTIFPNHEHFPHGSQFNTVGFRLKRPDSVRCAG
jgi:hypothetical protein